MFTRPKVIEPFQSARAMSLLPSCLMFELLLSAQPIAEIIPRSAAALQIQVIRATTDVLVGRLGGSVSNSFIDACSGAARAPFGGRRCRRCGCRLVALRSRCSFGHKYFTFEGARTPSPFSGCRKVEFESNPVACSAHS